MKGWGQSSALVAVVLTLAMMALVLAHNIFTPNPRELPLMESESSQYVLMAEGHGAETIAPFCKRVLYPFLVGTFARLTGEPMRPAFITLAVATFTFLVLYVAEIFRHFGLSPWLTAFFILTPLSMHLLEYSYMPDLLHTAMIALLFLLLLRGRSVGMFAVLLISFLARENTLVLGSMIAVLAWLRRQRALAAGAMLTTVAGVALGALFVRGKSNIHQLPDSVYLALKLPHQALKNFTGMRVWSDTLPIGHPMFTWKLPHPVGRVHEIGLDPYEWHLPAFTLVCVLTLFGSGPLLIWFLRRMEFWSFRHPLPIQLASVYGLFSFLLGPGLGDWVDRLMGYGWPLFWISLPYFLARSRREAPCLNEWPALISIPCLAWIPTLIHYGRLDPYEHDLLIYSLIVAAYVVAFFAIRRRQAGA